jgi:hypothetical protein
MSVDIHTLLTGKASAIILALLCLPLIARYIIRYLAFRNKLRLLKNRTTVVAEYQAPLDIPPAYFGVLIDNRLSMNDYDATVLWLHMRGLLKISYDESRQDYAISYLGGVEKAQYEHERYVLFQFNQKPGGLTWASELRKSTKRSDPFDAIQNTQEFILCLERDLQKDGYYRFNPMLRYVNGTNYLAAATLWAALKGLAKPWNWPALLLVYLYPVIGIVWFLLSLWFYNRLGIYSLKTDKWEQIWPQVAGYYRYLSVVEADRRADDLGRNPADFIMQEHDPYLVAGLLQSQWHKVFSPVHELGAGGKEYKAG